MVIPSEAQTIDELLDQAEAANRFGLEERALELVTEAIRLDSDQAEAYLFRGALLSESEQHEVAIWDYTSALRLDPRLSEAYNLRGLEHFKLAHIEEAIRDFDKAIELRPSLEFYHWQRGIALYYARRYQEGRQQFELHRFVNPDDVENSIWHFLCVTKLKGVRQARQGMIPIQNDRRVPMMEINKLFREEGTVEEVIAAARAGNPTRAEFNRRLLYADLYLGLYHEVLGNGRKALDHIKRAAQDDETGHYMAHVARVHLRLSGEIRARQPNPAIHCRP